MNFSDLLKGTAAYLTTRAKEALSWYKSKILNVSQKANTTEPDNILKLRAEPEIGKMYLFTYDPKLKNILPFWDQYPLVIPIHYYADGFLGLNLHYLPPLQRVALLQALSDVLSNDRYDSTTRMNISYGILKGAALRATQSGQMSKYNGYEQCIKRYLYGHCRTQFHEINANDWGKIVLLPLQKWVINKKSKYRQRPPY